MKGAILTILFFVIGIIVGKYDLIPKEHGAFALNSSLYLLLLIAGLFMGADAQNWRIVREFGFKIVLLPLTVILGTFAGAVFAFLLLSTINNNLSLRDCIGTSAGFGYYSLSSVIITRLGDAVLGSIALIANICRELTTLLLAPFMRRVFGKLAPVASGGAASMDVCLPVIMRYSGEHCAIMAVFSGMTLTIIVPFLVTIIFTWF